MERDENSVAPDAKRTGLPSRGLSERSTNISVPLGKEAVKESFATMTRTSRGKEVSSRLFGLVGGVFEVVKSIVTGEFLEESDEDNTDRFVAHFECQASLSC